MKCDFVIFKRCLGGSLFVDARQEVDVGCALILMSVAGLSLSRI